MLTCPLLKAENGSTKTSTPPPNNRIVTFEKSPSSSELDGILLDTTAGCPRRSRLGHRGPLPVENSRVRSPCLTFVAENHVKRPSFASFDKHASSIADSPTCVIDAPLTVVGI